MKAVVAAFNQEKALVGAFSVITNLRMELFEALPAIQLEFYILTSIHSCLQNLSIKMRSAGEMDQADAELRATICKVQS